MMVAICCVCKTITAIKEEQKSGLVYSHTYCRPCGKEVIEQIASAKVFARSKEKALHSN